jgi:ribosomal protein S18 acetylase RimI-like enzyme
MIAPMLFLRVFTLLLVYDAVLSFIPSHLSSPKVFGAQISQESCDTISSTSSLTRNIPENFEYSKDNCNFQIRQASIDDFNRIASLRSEVFYPELVSVGSFRARVVEKLQLRREEGSICLVVENQQNDIFPRLNSIQQTKLLGTVEFSDADFRGTSLETLGHERKLYIMDLAVSAEARRMGIASKLLAFIDNYARKNNYREMYLHVDVENEVARRLYRKFGYVEVPPVDWVISFTQARLHKPPYCYVLLWKEIF